MPMTADDWTLSRCLTLAAVRSGCLSRRSARARGVPQLSDRSGRRSADRPCTAVRLSRCRVTRRVQRLADWTEMRRRHWRVVWPTDQISSSPSAHSVRPSLTTRRAVLLRTPVSWLRDVWWMHLDDLLTAERRRRMSCGRSARSATNSTLILLRCFVVLPIPPFLSLEGLLVRTFLVKNKTSSFKLFVSGSLQLIVH